jgi:hypothetical protein
MIIESYLVFSVVIWSEMTTYSREDAVAAVRSYYEFLAFMGAIPESAVLEPPTSGWAELSSEALSALEKDETVIDLLKHLPYIDDRVDGNTEIAFKTKAINYCGSDFRWCIDHDKLEGIVVPVGAGNIPSYVAVLSEGGRYGSWLLLDTQKGMRSY